MKRKNKNPEQRKEETFVTLFTKNSYLYNYNRIPILKILNGNPLLTGKWNFYQTLDSKVVVDNPIEVYISYENYQKDGNIKEFYVKNQSVNSTFLFSLQETIRYFNTLTDLRLENCNLTAIEIESLGNILREFSNITDLNIDGNSFERYGSEKFETLLNDTNLEFLSLARCGIDINGMDKLCVALGSHGNLRMLNISGNRITDGAIIHLAKALRLNRSLVSLNLADNWITDKGCKILMSILQKFNLNEQEITLRRKIILDYNIQKYALKKQLEFSQSEIKSPTSEMQKLTKSNKSVMKASSSKTPSIKSAKEISKKSLVERSIEKYITLPNHPFVTDSTKNERNFCCVGNLKLANLNLAFNKIGKSGYRCIIQVLKYQARIQNELLGAGLIHLVLDGNNETCSEYNEINLLLFSKQLQLEAKD